MKNYLNLLPFVVITTLLAIGAYHTINRHLELRKQLQATRLRLQELQSQHKFELYRLTAALIKSQREALACQLEKEKNETIPRSNEDRT